MRTLVMTLAVSLFLVGCNYGKRNARACEDWIEAMDEKFAGTACQGTDFSSLILGGCVAYEDSKCDISAYFTCLEENTVCTENDTNAENEGSGTVNTEAWAECASLASCD